MHAAYQSVAEPRLLRAKLYTAKTDNTISYITSGKFFADVFAYHRTLLFLSRQMMTRAITRKTTCEDK